MHNFVTLQEYKHFGEGEGDVYEFGNGHLTSKEKG